VELAEMMHDPATRVKILGTTPDECTAFFDAYAQKAQGPGTDLQRQVAEETQRQLANYLRDLDVDGDSADRVTSRLRHGPQGKRGRADVLTSYGQGATHNPHAPGAALDDVFDNAVDFLNSIWHLNPDAGVPGSATQGKLAKIRNAASSVSPADGGNLVPEVLRARLLELAVERSVARARATVIPMDSARVPFPLIDVSSHETSLFGGMVAYWGEEGSALVDANPKFGRVVLDAQKLTGLSVVPNELLQDSIISFSALIERLWPRVLAFKEDTGFISGGGVGEPLGALSANNPALIVQAAEAGQLADTVILENVVNMYSRMLPTSLGNAVWLCSPMVLPKLFTMSLSVGTGGAPMMLMNVSGAAPMTLLGRPIVVTEQAEALGNQGDLSFVDFEYLLVGDRQMMTASSSTEWKFGNDQTAYRIIQRVDSRPWVPSALTPRYGGDSLSPFVTLAAR
jgi:HK97 family phage major capsid protein